MPLTTKALERLTVGKLLERYRDEVTPSKAGATYEEYRLNWLLNNEPGKTLARKSCAFLDRSVAWDYINARKKQKSMRGTPVTIRTIRDVRTIGLKTRQEHFARLLGIDLTVLRQMENSGKPLFLKCRRKTLLTVALMLELLGVRFTKDGWEIVERSVAAAVATPSKPGDRDVGYTELL